MNEDHNDFVPSCGNTGKKGNAAAKETILGHTPAVRSWLREDCLEFYRTEIESSSTQVKDRVGLLRLAINKAMAVKQRFPEAQFLEFGVHEGKDLVRMAAFLRSIEERKQSSSHKTTFHGFDSFEGLPEDWINGQINTNNEPFHKKGAFGKGGKSPDVDHLKESLKLGNHGNATMQKPTVRFHKGWFHESLPGFLTDHPHPIAFVHADADLYTSTKTFLTLLCQQRLFRKGTVLVFDEFWNYPHWQDGEYKAWMEIVDTFELEYEYFGYHAPHPGAKRHKEYGYQSVGIVLTSDTT